MSEKQVGRHKVFGCSSQLVSMMPSEIQPQNREELANVIVCVEREAHERLQEEEEEIALLALSVHALIPARDDSQVFVSHWPVCTRARTHRHHSL